MKKIHIVIFSLLVFGFSDVLAEGDDASTQLVAEQLVAEPKTEIKRVDNYVLSPREQSIVNNLKQLFTEQITNVKQDVKKVLVVEIKEEILQKIKVALESLIK